MASTSAMPNTEPMVTIKVNHDGQTRRFKIALRETGASKLEDKLREFLHIPQSAACKFERYSDSAGAYVVLDKNNISVYKQLYRAAKAKSKLKIRVTDMTSQPEAAEPEELEKSEEDKQVPQPATVEDVSESPSDPPPPLVSVAELEEEKKAEPVPETKPELAEPETKRTMAFRPRPFHATENVVEDFDQALAHLLQQKDGLMKDITNSLNSTPGLGVPSHRWEVGSLECTPQPPLIPVGGTCSRAYGGEFRVCCNNCGQTIPDVHYHCTKCDDDDFDLCPSCVDSGATCRSNDHWLIKRFKKDGVFVSSTTESIVPKLRNRPVQTPVQPPQIIPVPRAVTRPAPSISANPFMSRTCNSCVRELPDAQFLHCTTCDDYDLCQDCFVKDGHGHNPKHGFVPAVEGTEMPSYIQVKLKPGRNQGHNAICDGCDRYIFGIRHKCLDCPDWDFCNECIKQAKSTHQGHRFVPVYEPLAERTLTYSARPVHVSICCDGPLCAKKPSQTYITGVRYKCAVCHDTDFCANCEASPSNTHNKTHPLIMFKTAVRHVTVSTSGEHGNGKQMPVMGDRNARPTTSSRATETTVSRQVSMNSVQTVVDVEPTEQTAAKEAAVVEELEETKAKDDSESESDVPESEVEKMPAADDLAAIYVRDTVTDGTVLPTNHVFEQTWVLRNTGKVAWPAGCAVKFVGGDYMGHVDSNHPAGISELVSASESTVCYDSLEPGNEFQFTVLLRTPSREGKIISYWRLTAPDGTKFGHRLWCDVTVVAPKTREEVAATSASKEESPPATSQTSSQMIFPKLETESPVASIHEDVEPKVQAKQEQNEEDGTDDFDDCEEWDGSDEGFLTDEEYDILDASDEEYLEHSNVNKK